MKISEDFMSQNGQMNSGSPHTLKVGITGGIGSGKTTVCKVFEFFGIPVYYADERAKAIMAENKQVIKAVRTLFGPEAYQRNGSLNRNYIAAIVFEDKEKLAALNSIVHPAVFEDGENWHRLQKNVPYTIKEAALLFESGGYKTLDKTITVFAPKEVRIKRVMDRDGLSRSAVMSRIKNQMPDEAKKRLTDFVIKNGGTHLIIQQVWQIHHELLALSKLKK